MFVMNVALLARFERGEAMRLNVDEAICTKASSRGFLQGGLFGSVAPPELSRIRRRELALTSEESFVPINELREDLRLAEAVSVIGLWCGKEAKTVLFSVPAALTAKQILTLSKKDPDELQCDFDRLKKMVSLPIPSSATTIPPVEVERGG